jgi:hypothetical protein
MQLLPGAPAFSFVAKKHLDEKKEAEARAAFYLTCMPAA